MIKAFKMTVVFALTSALFGCANLSRSSDRGYGSKNSRRSSFNKRSSVVNKSPVPERDLINVSETTFLKKLENALSGRKELEQYSKALPWFSSDQEKIQFLQLPDFESRQRWLSDKGFNSRSSLVQSEMKELVEAQDIAIGMPQPLVRQSWGEPGTIEVSGNPQFRNERWLYHHYVSTPDGYKSEKKTVYFEGGKVIGWDVE